MTKEYSFVYFGEAVVYRTSKSYKVVLEPEETTILLSDQLVSALEERTTENENLLAILLAYMDYVRITLRGSKKEPPHRLEDKLVVEGVSLLLERFSIDELIIKIKTMKWHEIVGVLESPNPIERIQRL